jgi:hypothetical protein
LRGRRSVCAQTSEYLLGVVSPPSYVDVVHVYATRPDVQLKLERAPLSQRLCFARAMLSAS